MKRNYESGVADSITFFTGVEIEKTPAYGMKTLFVVGVHDPYTILDIVKESRSYTDQSKHITHIYFGANQSFKTNGVNDADTWRPWENMIYVCLAVIPGSPPILAHRPPFPTHHKHPQPKHRHCLPHHGGLGALKLDSSVKKKKIISYHKNIIYAEN